MPLSSINDDSRTRKRTAAIASENKCKAMTYSCFIVIVLGTTVFLLLSPRISYNRNDYNGKVVNQQFDTLPPLTIEEIIRSIALQNGNEFRNPLSYQSLALNWLVANENDITTTATTKKKINVTNNNYPTIKIYTIADRRTTIIQRYVLACLYFSTTTNKNSTTIHNETQHYLQKQRKGWLIDTSWLSNENECLWYGIDCNISRSVIYQIQKEKGEKNPLPVITSISLPNNNIIGLIPNEITLLSSTIRSLNLSNNTALTAGVNNTNKISNGSLNNDSGNWWLGELKQLESLYLGGCGSFFGFDGSGRRNNISLSILSRLTNLKEIDITNTFTSNDIDILQEDYYSIVFENLSHLTHLKMGGGGHNDQNRSKRRSATFLQEIGEKLTLLEYLDIQHYSISGTLDFMESMKNLIELRLDNNFLTGTIPASITSITSLKSLSLSGNKLTGKIPSDDWWVTTPNVYDGGGLTELRLSNNCLTGTIPSTLGQLSQLQVLQLEQNNLTGYMPGGICALRKNVLILGKGTLTSLSADCHSMGSIHDASATDEYNNNIYNPALESMISVICPLQCCSSCST